MPRIPTAEIDIDGRRKIVNADDPRVEEFATSENTAPESPEDVAKMKKGDVIDALELHGVDVDKSAKVDELREQLCSVIFTSL